MSRRSASGHYRGLVGCYEGEGAMEQQHTFGDWCRKKWRKITSSPEVVKGAVMIITGLAALIITGIGEGTKENGK